jgi:nucleotide-binding universal stress UspA family protein
MSTNVLLASHGTDGAKAAEKMALQVCEKGARLHHLLVVPSFWKGMTGDDWLNNGSTRDTFRRYLEEQLSQEVDEHIERVSEQAKQNELTYTREVVIGEPEQCLLDAFSNGHFDLVVLGSRRPKGKQGLRSTMSVNPLKNAKPGVKLLVVPYPDE